VHSRVATHSVHEEPKGTYLPRLIRSNPTADSTMINIDLNSTDISVSDLFPGPNMLALSLSQDIDKFTQAINKLVQATNMLALEFRKIAQDVEDLLNTNPPNRDTLRVRLDEGTLKRYETSFQSKKRSRPTSIAEEGAESDHKKAR
jgi:hypothetical protein